MLYEQCQNASSFQSPEVMKIAIRNFYPYYITTLSIPEIICIFNSNGTPRFACAFMKSLKTGKYTIFGNATGFNICGAVWFDLSIIEKALFILKRECGNIHFQKIREFDPICKYALSEKIPYPAAAIEFGNNYNIYFQGLSKSVR